MNQEVVQKKKEFKAFLMKRNPSESFSDRYIRYLNARVVRNVVQDVCSNINIWEVTDMSELITIYTRVKANIDNIRLHNIYSGAISAYMKFLQGKELRRRVIKDIE